MNVHDFVSADGKVAPYGVYDLHKNEAWVSVGISHDTAEFAVETGSHVVEGDGIRQVSPRHLARDHRRRRREPPAIACGCGSSNYKGSSTSWASP